MRSANRRGDKARDRNLFDIAAARSGRLERLLERRRRLRLFRFPDDGGDARGAHGCADFRAAPALPGVEEIEQDRRCEADAQQYGDDDEAGDLRRYGPRREATEQAHQDASTAGVKI